MEFAIDDDRSIDFGPGKESSGVGCFHIDATMGHGGTKIVVPIGTVETVAHSFWGFVVVEEHNIGNIGKVIVGAEFTGAAGHFLGADFTPNVESTVGGAIPFAGRDGEFVDEIVVFESHGLLVGKIDLNSF